MTLEIPSESLSSVFQGRGSDEREPAPLSLRNTPEPQGSFRSSLCCGLSSPESRLPCACPPRSPRSHPVTEFLLHSSSGMPPKTVVLRTDWSLSALPTDPVCFCSTGILRKGCTGKNNEVGCLKVAVKFSFFALKTSALVLDLLPTANIILCNKAPQISGLKQQPFISSPECLS